ncbi:hypothetical protein BpHYR1_026358 [Brachionus plicatilis]|uniref:Uncharacterized protein n=1 Tax=Brachionus plicatilis TaxID=10195 RepID=A0A3M7S1K5_BRAPC|nr:hypothetical protein BpHYR1_026358 [Brachionus plicatilis]
MAKLCGAKTCYNQYICGSKDASVATIYITCFGPTELCHFLCFVFVFYTKFHNVFKNKYDKFALN